MTTRQGSMQIAFNVMFLSGIIALAVCLPAIAEAALIGYWNFNETSGSTAFDSALGNGAQDGALQGGAAFAPGQGIQGGALSLGNTTSNDYVTMGNNFGFGGTAPFSVQAWVKTTQTTGGVPVSKHQPGVVNGYFLAINDVLDGFGGTNKAHFYESDAKPGSSANVNDGKWHQLVGVYDGTTASFYFDGAFASSVSGASVVTNTSNFLVGIVIGPGGACGSVCAGFQGLIDEVKVWDNALTSNDVASEFTPVPEPSMGILVGTMGLIAIGGALWRRSRRR